MTTPFQRLGAFVYTGENLSDDELQAFANIGGYWVAPVVYNDDAAGPWNLANLEQLKQRMARFQLLPGIWANGAGGDPIADATNIAGLAIQHKINFVVLDLEYKYQYNPNDPACDVNKMPIMVQQLRKLLPDAWIIVSTNGMNNSMIWNGRTLNPVQSFYDLGIRVAPQWYSSYYQKNMHTSPEAQMSWLKQYGGTDFNFRDGNAAKTHYRGLPLSYVHGTAEISTLEGSSMSAECRDMVNAMQYGLTPGMSIYTLDGCGHPDLSLLASYRGKLYL